MLQHSRTYTLICDPAVTAQGSAVASSDHTTLCSNNVRIANILTYCAYVCTYNTFTRRYVKEAEHRALQTMTQTVHVGITCTGLTVKTLNREQNTYTAGGLG